MSTYDHRRVLEYLTDSLKDEKKKGYPKINFKHEYGKTVIQFRPCFDPDIAEILEILESEHDVTINDYVDGIQMCMESADIYLRTSLSIFKAEVKFEIETPCSEKILEKFIKLYKKLNSQDDDTIEERLQKLGIELIKPSQQLTFDNLAGYESVKLEIQQNIIAPLQHPDVFEGIARATRTNYESNIPRAVLFEGLPGTGKTLAAKIIGSQLEIPLLYIAIESIMSKWYSESYQNLAKVFDIAGEFEKSILFFDELDCFATNRDSSNGNNDENKKVLSVLLQRMYGIKEENKYIILGATNRKEDLDRALRNRFSATIYFPLPNPDERAVIFEFYAKHLSDEERTKLAVNSLDFSGRDIKEACLKAERAFGLKVINDGYSGLPTLADYTEAVNMRRNI